MKSREQLEELGREMSRVTQLLAAVKAKRDIARVVSAEQALRRATWAFHEGDATSVEMCIIDLKGLRE